MTLIGSARLSSGRTPTQFIANFSGSSFIRAGRQQFCHRDPHRASFLAFFALFALFALFAFQAWTPCARAETVNVTITSDNAYSFGYGTATGLSSLYGGIENCTAGEIFNCTGGPESYTATAQAGDYLYIIAYSDGSMWQGTLGQFSGSNTVFTGNAAWEVYATGHDIDPNCYGPSNSPSLADINIEIALANSNAGGTGSSVGWVSAAGGGSGTVGALAVGDLNIAGNQFPVVCGIGSGASWMWYNPDPSTITNAFVVGSPPNLPANAGEYLIFRIPGEAVIPTEASSWGRIKATYR